MEIIAIALLIGMAIFIEVRLYKYKILPHIQYACKLSKEEVFEGDDIEIIEKLINPGRFLIPCIKAEITTSKYVVFAKKASAMSDKTRSVASLFAIHGGQKITRVWKAKCVKRGMYHIENTSIVGSDLFGAYHYSKLIEVKGDLIVLPQPIDVEGMLEIASKDQGEYVVKRFILEDPFRIAGVREYHETDGMNKIHWKSTASKGQLMVRNNESTSQKEVTVLFNTQTYIGQLQEPIRDERYELGIKVAAGEINKTLANSVPVRLLANGYVDEEKNELVSRQMWGQSHVHDLFVLLAQLGDSYSRVFDKFLESYKESICTSEIVLITCYLDEAMMQFIYESQERGVRVKVYLMAHEAESIHYDQMEVYYLMDYLKG